MHAMDPSPSTAIHGLHLAGTSPSPVAGLSPSAAAAAAPAVAELDLADPHNLRSWSAWALYGCLALLAFSGTCKTLTTQLAASQGATRPASLLLIWINYFGQWAFGAISRVWQNRTAKDVTAASASGSHLSLPPLAQSLSMLASPSGAVNAVASPSSAAASVAARSSTSSLLVLIAVLDVVGCVLCLLATLLIGSGLYQVLYSSILPMTALLSRWILNYRQNKRQWLCLLLVTLGLCASSLSPAASGGGIGGSSAGGVGVDMGASQSVPVVMQPLHAQLELAEQQQQQQQPSPPPQQQQQPNSTEISLTTLLRDQLVAQQHSAAEHASDATIATSLSSTDLECPALFPAWVCAHISAHTLGILLTLAGTLLYAGQSVLCEALNTSPSLEHVGAGELNGTIGWYGLVLSSLYIVFHTLPHWNELVAAPMTSRALSLSDVGAVLGLYLVANVFHRITYWSVVERTGSIFAGLANALRTVLVFLLSGALFCGPEAPGQCLTAHKCYAALLVVAGVVGYQLCPPSAGARRKHTATAAATAAAAMKTKEL